MPTFHIGMFEDRSAEQKYKLVEGVTCTIYESLGYVPDAVDIIITDIRRENWATDGVL